MTDTYTPTTEDVRADYAETYEGTNERRYARFDRWLAAHDAEMAARQIDAPSVREAIGEVLADMEATAEGTHIASSLALLQEITDAAIRAAVSPPSRTAKRTGYETVGHGVGEHSQKITARATVPDAPRCAVHELIEEARGFWGSETREYTEGLVSRLADALEAAGAERDAATAAVERVRAIHVRHKDTHKPDPSVINGNWFCCGAVQLGAVDPYACIACDSPEWPCPTLAALDGAPEPEVKK